MNTEQIQQQAQHAVDIATSSPATVAGVTAGTTTVLAGLPLTIQILTVFVLTCQAAAWIWKGYNWYKNKDNS